MSLDTNLSSCRGPNRRELLRLGLLSAWGFSLADLFRLQAQAAAQGAAPTAKVKSCILIWQAGGPSHVDTFDPKPDAPKEYRGEFKAIETSVPGLRISEVYPNLAKLMDRVALVRTVTSPEGDHGQAAHHLLTGFRPTPALVYPTYGSVVAKAREATVKDLPPYVAVPEAPMFVSSGYLTPAYDSFEVNGDPNAAGFRVRDLTPPDRLTLDRLRRRREMVKRLDGFSHDVSETPLTASRDQFSEKAYELLTSKSTQNAFNMESESKELRDKYGRNAFGQSCLLARRLVEAGVDFVTVNDRGTGQLGWDTHAQNFPTIKNTLAPPLDQGVSALIEDLATRGLLDNTLVVMMGEFGRTPKINNNAGRDHHPRANSVLLAGGGLAKGALIGRTDARAEQPADRPVVPADLAATIFTVLGIDPNRQFQTPDGQPIRLVDKGQAIRELL